MENLNIFKNPDTKERLKIKSTLLIYRLRDIVKRKPNVRLGSASDNTYMLLFGASGNRSYLMQEAIVEYHNLATEFSGKKIGELV